MAILKVIELMADSTKSWEDAAQQAVTEASKTLHNRITALRLKTIKLSDTG